MKYVTMGSFIIRHEAGDQEQADRTQEHFFDRIEGAMKDGVIVSDHLLIGHTHLEDDVAMRQDRSQLNLFEE